MRLKKLQLKTTALATAYNLSCYYYKSALQIGSGLSYPEFFTL